MILCQSASRHVTHALWWSLFLLLNVTSLFLVVMHCSICGLQNMLHCVKLPSSLQVSSQPSNSMTLKCRAVQIILSRILSAVEAAEVTDTVRVHPPAPLVSKPVQGQDVRKLSPQTLKSVKSPSSVKSQQLEVLRAQQVALRAQQLVDAASIQLLVRRLKERSAVSVVSHSGSSSVSFLVVVQ